MIHSAPAYEAYVSKSSQYLTTSEGLIPISTSVWRALLDLRYSDRRRILWIDAVSIHAKSSKILGAIVIT